MIPLVFALLGELSIGANDWQIVKRESGPVNYYAVASDDGLTFVRSKYVPGLKTAVLGWQTPDADRRRVKKVRWTWRVQTLPNGGERVIVVTDRPLGSWSRTAWRTATTPPSKEAQLTLIEMRLNRQGRGEGKISLGSKIAADGDTLALENYAGAPVLLKGAMRVNDGPTH